MDQMWPIKDWKIVRTKTGKDPEFGYPLGECICIRDGDIEFCANKWNVNVTDLIVMEYKSHDGEP